MVDDKATQKLDQAQPPADLKRNALHLSAVSGSVDAVAKILSSTKLDINATDTMGYTALQIAAIEGQVEIVRFLIKQGADINVQDKVHGNTALHEACWRGYSRTVTTIAKSKSNLHILNNGGFAALHLCCQNGHNQSCRELLLAGCGPDIKNNYGDTPLHTSARYGHAGVTRILISAECRVSQQNKNGDTALHISAAMGRRKLTRILIEAGCDEQLLNKQQESAKDIAVRKDLKEIIAIFNTAAFQRTEQKRKSGVSLSKSRDSAHLDKNRESRNSNRSKESRERKKKQKSVAPNEENGVASNWSPYGCHYSPDPEDFPQPRMDSLPEEPLRKGEQYYLDLGGNIRKGPVGVGYTCYCAPFFRHIEAKIEKSRQELRESLEQAKHSFNKRIGELEERANLHVADNERSIWLKYSPQNENESGPVSRSRSLEILIDDIQNVDRPDTLTADASLLSQRLQSCKLSPTVRSSVLESIWRSHRSSLQNSSLDIAPGPKIKKTHKSMHDINLVISPEDRLAHLSEFHKGKESPESGLVSSEPSNTNTHTPDLPQESVSKYHSNLWLNKNAEDVSESSDDEDAHRSRRRGPYIENNDSGYSMKMCSNSQGPSPSLSVRLEADGLTNGGCVSPHSAPPENTNKTLRLPPTDLVSNVSLV